MHDPKMVEMVARAMRIDADGRDDWADNDDALRRAWLSSATAALDVLAAAGWQRVPDGWVAVPREPTREMRRAFHDVNERYNDHGIGESPDSQWRAMLAAAPRPEDQA